MKNHIVIIFIAVLFWPVWYGNAADIALPEIGDSAGSLISPQQEYRIGQAFFWRLQQSVDLVDDPEVNSYLSRLGQRLVTHSDSPSLPFKFFMVPDPSVNAFAAPGGFIGVNSGLLLTSQREDELASVMAHEIAHVTQRHLIRSFEKNKQSSLPRTAALVGAVLLAAVDAEAGIAAITVVQASGMQARIDHTRIHEAEADNLGMLNLVKSGFDAHAMPTFFERLQQSSRFYTGNAVPEFLRSHPVTTSRIAEARGRAVTYPLKSQRKDNLQFYLMREKLRVMSTTNLTKLKQHYLTVISAGNNRNVKAVRYGYSLTLSAMGDHRQARAELQKLIVTDGERLSYQLALADIEMASGRVSEALKIYQANQKLFPNDQALTMKQVGALLQARLPKQGATLLLRQLELGHRSSQIYKLLAQAQGDMGKTSDAHSWLAEYYYSAGRMEQAADQLKLAVKAAGGNQYQLAKFNARLQDVEATLAQLEAL
jgi:predicted Zn-dependent protease